MPADTASVLAGGQCPVIHKSKDAEGAKLPEAKPEGLLGGSKCPVIHKQPSQQSREEPPDTPDRPLELGTHTSATVRRVESNNPLEVVPASEIPAAGRGNSDDGQSWLNPSANQLFRALRRKDKPIEVEDALAVAAVHELVTDWSWKGVMEYENMHERACPNPTLARFEGKDGIYSIKARIMSAIFGVRPFDRHDWTVDRCGKEVRYIIDYYAVDDGMGDTDYFVDARPAGLQGVPDRMRLAFSKWQAGERWWW
ncbi:uncharacterized protein MONBRDRAFT_38782 [Monosiga brevicollis MX1]|uniref:Holocytochrome c-type synthase n=1 Tax=Monosiga brevicollis TaxID=81824 RepID=A9VA32_MONBE|nr:uncharacterized protein MONBRDRAFT_38782 [Monosiga brevicollis MX1]EDQ85657.1 predicted protein [Monosiga brevicollis MX1]|eukprot:XP_001749606.1 hypothetical protein [Monosiga brevicollis MX1]